MSQITTGQIAGFTARKLARLHSQSRNSSFRSTLAHLRRGVGRAPGDVPELWGFFLDEMPQDWMGNREPSRAEWAIYTALTLFALHQQSKDPQTEWMSRKGALLGKSIAQLIEPGEEDSRIARRFYALVTASSMEELAYHMRGLVQLLRSKSIPLDYPALAEDLYWYQNPANAPKIRLQWGREFYDRRSVSENTNIDEEDKNR